MTDSYERFEECSECSKSGLQNKIEDKEEESDKAAVRRERFVGSTFCTF